MDHQLRMVSHTAAVVFGNAAGEQGKLVSPAMMKRMKENFMGYDGTRDGKHGTYYYKNGVWADAQTRGIYSVVMHFPNNVQVAWHSNARETKLGWPETLIKNVCLQTKLDT